MGVLGDQLDMGIEGERVEISSKLFVLMED